jgi:hypothetical protein
MSRRRTGPAPTLPCRRLGAAPKLRRKVRILPVPLFEFPCRVRVARARRRQPSAPPRSPSPSSPTRLRCPGSTPCNASYVLVLSPPKIMAPSRRSDRLAGAPPPLAAGTPPLPRLCSPRAARWPSNGPDRDLTPVKPVYTGQPSRIRSQPLDRDPTDQIQPFSLNRALLLRKPEFFPICNPVLPP